MDLTAASEASDKRRWLVLAGLAAVPVYVLPVGFFGVRALWPRMLRDVATGAIALGMLSLMGLGVSGLTQRKKTELASGRPERWKLPFRWPSMPEEFAASAASGH